MVDAVVNVFLEKLLNTLEEQGRAVTERQKQFEDLQHELQYMQGFLKDAERLKRKNNVLRSAIADLGKLVYEAEDILADCQLGDGDGDGDDEEQRFSNRWLPRRIAFLYKSGKRLREINEKTTTIKNTMQSYLTVPNDYTARIYNERWSSSVYDHTQVVGLEGDKAKIKEWLLRADDKELLMIAFVGMGGLGKTTIAQEVFNDKETEDQFERRIWVSVSQTFTEEQIMRSILRNLGDASVEDDLGVLLWKIKHYSLGKTYLLVMDDVWDKNLGWWDKIYQGLPRGNSSSIIVTTRFESVALKVQARDKIHRPELLSPENSWLLFCKVAFAENGGNCEYLELEEVGKEIVRKCKGLPLAIKAIGGTLLYKHPVYHEWKRIADNFQDELADSTPESKDVMATLQLSYDELPAYLKPCFLSLSLYPEDCIMPRQQLIHWWIGEGFVQLRNGRTRTEAGEDCFSGLTNRCLIETVDKTYSGTISTCKIHDMVRDLVIKIAEEDAFFKPKGVNCRHLGISSDLNEKQLISKHKLRGIVSTTKTGKVNQLQSNLAKKFTECRYLRVLDISKSIFEAHLSGVLDRIGSLRHLTYLSLSNTHPLVQLPPSLAELRNLQILDVSYCQNLKQLPSCVVSFKKLCVLDMTHCSSLEFIPKGIGSLLNLEVLLGFKPSRSNNGCRISELKNLRHLRKLGLYFTRGDEIGEDEMDCLSNLGRLQFVSISCFDSYGDDLVTKIDKLAPPPQIHELCLQFYPGRLSPSWLNPSSLPMLRYLSICSGNLAQMHERFWGISGNTFWRIEGLMLNLLSELTMDWNMVRQVMPSLRTVNASWCPELDSFPIQDVGFRGGFWTKTAQQRN